jgi:hypothetical protein
LIRAGVVEVDALATRPVVIQIEIWALPRCLVTIGVNIGVRAVGVMARPKL